jgi:hypothetical protein
MSQFNKAEFAPQASVEIHNMKFHESPPSGTQYVSRERAEGRETLQ